MLVSVRKETGYALALEGIGLSFNVYDIDRLGGVAEKLAPKDGGHNKFLESMMVWIDIDAPRYWWSEFDTYRVGTTKQSESTMHTITHRLLTQDDFEFVVYGFTLRQLNDAIKDYQTTENKQAKARLFAEIKNNLPEGFLQRRIVCTNYKTLKNIVWQRKHHKLLEWKAFIKALADQLEHPEFVGLVKVKEVEED